MKPNIGQGDSGKTNLIGSDKKVLKSSCNIESIGALDELVSLLGYIKAEVKTSGTRNLLEKIQDHLFRIESHVSVLPEFLEASLRRRRKEASFLPRIGEEHIAFLEKTIEEYEKNLPELQNFILPGGTKLAALFHIARTETRRVERILVRTSKKRKIHPYAIPYLNRLSDVFFTLARWVNCKAGIKETKWIGLGKKGI